MLYNIYMILGIDIGGTTVKIGIVQDEKIIDRITIDTKPKTLIQDIKDAIVKSNYKIEDFDSIGAAFPGFIDHDNGIIKLSGNLGYKDVNISDEFEKVFGIKAHIINDANAATLGEFWQGSGKYHNSIILYTLGTGVGGGVVINGNLVFGASGFAGELGHGGHFQDKFACTCGLKGCIEPASSAVGIERYLLEETGEALSVKDSVPGFLSGDEKIVRAFTKALTPLAKHIAIMETAINPDAIIIGGGPSNIGQPLADFIKKLVDKYQLYFISDSTKINVATTKNDAGIFGAAYWAVSKSK